MYTIYKLQSTKTNKLYIGCTSQSLRRRLIFHISHFNSKTNSKQHLHAYKQMDKDGLDILDFAIEAIKEIEDKTEAFAYERKMIKEYRNSCGVFNNDFSENHWAKGTKGVCKPNSGSFKKGKEPNETSFKKGNKAWNKGIKGVQVGSCKDTVFVNNGKVNKRIQTHELDSYLSNGYTTGMKPRK